MRITSIERPPRKQRYEVRVDHVLVVPLSREVLAAANLRAGQEIDDARIARLEAEEARHHAMTTALRLLGYRPRSEREMRDALHTRRVPADVADETLERLRQLRLLDDRAFAESWTESRQRNSPRSRRLLMAELAQKGVKGEAARESLATVDDEEAAFQAARKRALGMKQVPYTDFRRKLADFLARRGFDYETCSVAIKRLWAESNRSSCE